MCKAHSEPDIRNQVPNSNTIADEDGVGGGVVDYLKCKGFVNNSRPLNDENYDNLKSQCTFVAAKKIMMREAGEITKDSSIVEMDYLYLKCKIKALAFCYFNLNFVLIINYH